MISGHGKIAGVFFMSLNEIRELTYGDLDGLFHLRNDAAMHKERLSAQSEGTLRYLGAFVNGGVVGFVLIMYDNKVDVMLYTDNQPCMDMVDLYVDESMRGMGIGSALITAAERVCAERNVPYMGLDVNPEDNPKALALYTRLGYMQVGGAHLDGVYASQDEHGNATVYEDWCVDMIKLVYNDIMK